MLAKISPHLKKLAQKSSAVKREFFPSKKEKVCSSKSFIDPLLEEKYKKVKGLVHKYPRRVLVELSLNCASFCRFCTRRRKVSDIKKGKLDKKNIFAMIDYIKSQPEINEVILSGGDPLMAPDLLVYALEKFSQLVQIKIIRIHTRVPVSNPWLISNNVLKAISKIKKQPIYISIHFEHPDELTPQTIKAIQKLRAAGGILYSQSVFLKGINDSVEVLEKLFTRLLELGVRPYYIYRCDLVKGAEHFIVPIAKEVKIMTEVRKKISGLAYPTYVVDTPNGSGKIPVPLGFWKTDYKSFTDFSDKKIEMY